MIEIPKDIVDAMVRHAFAELPNEACGLLAGSDGRAERWYPMRNADRSEMTYRLDPKEQLDVFNEIEEKGWELVGIVHSHTHTAAYPSETDRRQAFYPDAAYILVSLADRSKPVIAGYSIRDEVVEEREVKVV